MNRDPKGKKLQNAMTDIIDGKDQDGNDQSLQPGSTPAWQGGEGNSRCRQAATKGIAAQGKQQNIKKKAGKAAQPQSHIEKTGKRKERQIKSQEPPAEGRTAVSAEKNDKKSRSYTEKQQISGENRPA